MQFGMAHSGCSVHDNVIRDVGLENIEVQTRGIQIGTYSGCDVRRNQVLHGPTIGIFVLNALDTTVADNLVVDFDDDAIYANLGSGPAGTTYRFVHNTVAEFGGQAIRVFGDGLEESVAWNNLVIGDASDIAAGNDVGWTATGNLAFPSVGEAGLYGSGDYHLLESSPARGAGTDHAPDGFSLDLEGRAR
ncbi:MAG TPA: right-handed parallel beta-helix repeat-containing protein, partial [Flavobacteriales bacterium]|nr:right-handed parallel beta-helix repeat-containing protein [Flavobacteriales bacterium]